MDGADWPRIVKEYEDDLGLVLEKTERTFKTYQQRALQRIVEVSKSRLSFSWYE